MSDEIRNALTAEEWTERRVRGNGFVLATGVDGGCVAFHGLSSTHREVLPYLLDEREAHALAALCLFSQPFGFTRDDVKLLQRVFDMSNDEWRTDDEEKGASLAARIAALLPPEGP